MQYFSFFTTQLSIIVLAARTMVSSNKQAEYPNIFSGKFKLSSRDWKSSKICSTWVFISFCKRSFQKNPTMRSITRLQLSVIIECFLTSKFCKGFLTLQVQQSSLGHETTVFNYFPSRQFLCPSKLRYQGKILVKCVQKGTFF